LPAFAFQSALAVSPSRVGRPRGKLGKGETEAFFTKLIAKQGLFIADYGLFSSFLRNMHVHALMHWGATYVLLACGMLELVALGYILWRGGSPTHRVSQLR
jgi:hypothetical protein